MGSRRRAAATLLAVVGFALHATAFALSIDFAPSAITTSVGGTFSVELVVSGLKADGQILSTYDLDVLFDSSHLSFVSAVETNALCDQSVQTNCVGQGSSIFSATPGSGQVNLFDLSLASDAQLAAQQGDPLEIVMLTFRATSAGVTSLDLSANALGGSIDPNTASATDLLALNPSFGGASIDISTVTAPEPSPPALLVPGLVALLLARRVRRRPA